MTMHLLLPQGCTWSWKTSQSSRVSAALPHCSWLGGQHLTTPCPAVILLRLEGAIDAVELPGDHSGVTKPGR